LFSEKTVELNAQVSFASRLRDYGLLFKMRLTSLVVFSAAMGFVIATRGVFDLQQMLWLIFGGFLVTGS
jgi:heme o synthase